MEEHVSFEDYVIIFCGTLAPELNFLRNDGFRFRKQEDSLSVYPKHTLEDEPIQQFEELNLDDVNGEIEDSGFHFEEKYCGFISHGDGLNDGGVSNFRKAKE